jgi:hypothetical protein
MKKFNQGSNMAKNLNKFSEEYLDLNRVSEEENQRAKAEMDLLFNVNRLKPGDPGYVWDKRVDFTTAEESNEWDEED